MMLRGARATKAVFATLAIAALAQAAGRAADEADAIELAAVALTVATIQQELASRSEAASGDARFELYRDLDRSIASWYAVDALRERIVEETATTSADERERLQADLTDRARFALAQLDLHIDDLARRIVSGGEPTPVSLLRDEIRLARQARVVVERLALGTP
jgi:hypothetical protein